MIFSRTYRYVSAVSEDDMRSRLVGKHMKVHNLDFEVSEKDKMLKIIPHAEQDTNIRTLPITHVEFKGKEGKTQVVISTKMRKIDSGGPMLIMVFVSFMIIASLGLFVLGDAKYMTYTYVLGGIGVGIFAIFWMRMETGYFDYVRKIRDYIKKQTS
ncbi:MAG: hypothetical protein H6551_07040 [Chitinophagales bacterium]|nr:hypothetical protein [Chitinophagaceae bacterium]MCB9064887.1 hypothetical protein [Chitinophagales bacterium]